VIDEGVIFEGETRMYRAKGPDESQPVVVGSDEYHNGPPPTITAIHGIVTDQVSGKPIKNAVAECKGSDTKSTHTNASGYYELINLKDGKCKLKIKASGYHKEKTQIEISGGGAYQQDFALKPK